jgi:hypothetical protein
MNQQIGFEGSDEDIRTRFEAYLTQLLATLYYEKHSSQEADPNASKHFMPLFRVNILMSPIEKVDYVSDYNQAFVKAWKETENYRVWDNVHDSDFLCMLK